MRPLIEVYTDIINDLYLGTFTVLMLLTKLTNKCKAITDMLWSLRRMVIFRDMILKLKGHRIRMTD